MLAIPHVVVAVNKMDLVDFSAERFAEIEADLQELADRLGLHDPTRDPDVGAPRRQRRRSHRRDALVRRPDAARASRDDRDRRRPQPLRPPLPGAVGDPADDRRAPRLPRLRRADRRRRRGAPATRSSCCPSGRRTRVAASRRSTAPLEPPIAPQSVTIRLEDDIDVSPRRHARRPRPAADRRARADARSSAG